MKLLKRLHKPKRPVELGDAAKLGKVYGKLTRVSHQAQRKELAQSAQSALAAKPRSGDGLSPVKASNTKVTLNLRGNLRGMQHKGDSEHMKKVRAMRRFYNKQMPVLHCSACAFASTCPQFKAGYQCAFLPYLNAHNIESETDLVDAMKNVAGANVRRMHLATMLETLSGGAPSLELTEALALTFQNLAKLHEISTASNATVTVETDDNSVIGRIFGSMDDLLHSTRAAQAQPIDAEPPQFALPNPVDIPVDFGQKSEVNQELMQAHTKDELERTTGQRYERPAGSVPVVTVTDVKLK